MPRDKSYFPHGVIPAVLLSFNDDLTIDEKSFRRHLRDVTAVKGLSSITINAHSTELAFCTFDEQRRVLAIAQDEIGERVPIIAFQYPLATGQGYPRDTLLKMCEQVPTIRAIKDWPTCTTA